jgi:hypothetical protein
MANFEIKATTLDERWSGPQRSYWIAHVKVTVLRAGARRKLAHHKQRWDHWNKELAKALKAVKGSVEIRSHQVTGGVQHNAVMDQEKAQYLELCRKKVETHQERIVFFTSYVGLLAEVRDDATLPLSREDAEVFGLGERAANDRT